jgi:hypothetical protein
LEEQSESKGISPTFSKSMVKRIGVFQNFVKNEVKLFKTIQDRNKTNVFVSNCVEEEKRKNEASFFWGEKAKKNKYNRSSTIKDLPLLACTAPGPGQVYSTVACAVLDMSLIQQPAWHIDMFVYSRLCLPRRVCFTSACTAPGHVYCYP